ncbi:MAG TPA: tetratricopeptide repeat protein [Opitutaceae bacterium]|jgi:TolA-binding protein|nr:tetratricopeptide repeat protein [Opitutaceae bacterium]
MTRIRPSSKHLSLKAAAIMAILTGASLRADTEVAPAQAADMTVPGNQPATPVSLSTQDKRADEIRGTINLGSHMTDRSDFEGAEIAYRQVLNSRDASPAAIKAALLGLAHMHRKKGELTKAVAIYEKYLKDYPGDDLAPDALLDLGRSLREMGAYTTAIARFYSVINSTLKLPPGGFMHYQQLAKTAQFEIAETHFQAGEYAEAGKFFSRLRLLDLAPPDRAHAHFMAAYSLYLQKNMEATVNMLNSFLDQWPDDENVPEARYMLATSLRAMKRPQEAFAATLQLLQAEKSRVEANPKRWSYWQRRTGNQLANDFFEDGDIMNAEAIYAGLAAISDDPAWQLPVTYQLALCDERLGNTDKARLSYEKVVDSVKGDAQTSFLELKRLAAWRLGELDWRESVSHKVSALMDTQTGHLVSQPPKKAAAPVQ